MLNFQLPMPATSAIAAFVPLIMGFIWYNPKVFGAAWMQATGMTQDSMKGSNMALIFGLTYVLSFFIAISLHFAVIHQFHLFSMLAGEPALKDPNSPLSQTVAGLMHGYGYNYRTFKHGALHGTITGIFLVLPIIAINAMFERKGFKYIMINAGFWIVNLAIMGAIVCHFTAYMKM